MQSSKRLEDMKSEISTLEEKKVTLESMIAYKRTNEFVEERARNALNLIKPGEKVYISELIPANSVVIENGKVVEDSMPKEKTNAQLWVELFL